MKDRQVKARELEGPTKKWRGPPCIWANYSDQPAEVTPNSGLVRESSHNPLNSGLGIIVICPGAFFCLGFRTLGSLSVTLREANSELPLKISLNAPKGNESRIPTIHFQVLLLLVSGRVSTLNFKKVAKTFPSLQESHFLELFVYL